jgi:RND family efflux transporter MFP subunit
MTAVQAETGVDPLNPPAENNTDNNSVRVLLLPSARATLSSQMNANLISLPFEIGERFKKGDKLAVFDCSVLQQQLRKANAELDIAEANHASNKKLLALQSVSKLELQISAAEVKKAQAQVGVVAARNRYCYVKAPYNGYVVKRHVNEHENVSQGHELIDIISDGKPRIQMFVPSKWISWLKIGMPFSISIDETQKTYDAKVQRFVGQVDPVSQTIEVHAVFTSKSDDLLPGMSGQAHFELSK